MYRQKEPVIIDTDIGDDIDDALAVVLAAASPELKILGITTVYKNTISRAKIASSLLSDCGHRRIPVVPGIRLPMSRPADASLDLDELPCQYDEGMDNSPIALGTSAVDFMEATLSRSRDPVTIITLGALTNVAALLLRNNRCMENIKRLVIMGGAYFSHIKEYNIGCDPQAAHIVFSSGLDITAVGLDVTLQCILSEAELETIRKSPRVSAQAAWSLIRLYRKKIPGAAIFLHDPLAVAAAFEPELVSLKERKITVETQGAATTGLTFNLSDSNWWLEHDPSNIKVARSVDRDRLVSLFLRRIAG